MSALFKSHTLQNVRPARQRQCLKHASPGVLRRWNEPGVELAIWERGWSGALCERLDRLALIDMPRARFIARAGEVEASVAAGLSATSCSDETVLSAVAMDIEALVARYAEASGSSLVEVRLEAIGGDACRLFHVDRTRSRLVTTYAGPGTEWVTQAYAQDALRDRENYAGPVERLTRFAVGIFPGSLSRAGGLVHRSPRIAGTGQVRLLLCMTEFQS